MILLRDNCHMSQALLHGTATFILRIKVEVNVFLVLWIFLTGYNISQRAIPQNIANLHHFDL